MNNIQDIVNKYSVVNFQWGYLDDNHKLINYLSQFTANSEDVNVLNIKYGGIRGYFVRHSINDDNEVGYDYNNVDMWNRKFKAYKRGNKLHICGQYRCEPIFENRVISVIPKAYVLTTSVEGSIVYCVDVIENIN